VSNDISRRENVQKSVAVRLTLSIGAGEEQASVHTRDERWKDNVGRWKGEGGSGKAVKRS
jgi:hypothetical protein